MVEVKTGDRVVVTLESAGEFPFFEVNDLDFAVRATDGEGFGGFIECKSVSYMVPCVDGDELLDLSDVPLLYDTVSVACGDELTTDAENGIVDCV